MLADDQIGKPYRPVYVPGDPAPNGVVVQVSILDPRLCITDQYDVQTKSVEDAQRIAKKINRAPFKAASIHPVTDEEARVNAWRSAVDALPFPASDEQLAALDHMLDA